MGAKGFDKVKYKTLLTEANSRMTIRRGKKVNELYRVKQKIADFVTNGDMNSALIYIDNYINEENKLKVYDVLCTMCDQLKGRITEVETYGITDDLSANANAIVYASHRLDIKELESLAEILKEVMPKIEYKEAMNGTWVNDVVRENISYRKWEKGETYLKLIEICMATETQCILKEEWKKVLREYCYKNQIDYPYSAEEDLSYNPASEPHPMPAPYYPPGGYGPPPSGFIPAPTYIIPATDAVIYPGGGFVPQPTIATPAADFSNPDKPPKPSKEMFNNHKPAEPAPKPSGGYTLPPPPSDLNLPKYGIETKKPADKKKVESEEDDSDDEDLMARLKNLQK